MAITPGFYSESIPFRLRDVKKKRSWLLLVIASEEKFPGELNYVFCDDDFLHAMNLQFLAHDTLTDVITFDNSQLPVVAGEIYISIDRVKENAKLFGQTFNGELNRVMVHGLLHLCGYKDKSKKDFRLMREKEDHYLSKLSSAN